MAKKDYMNSENGELSDQEKHKAAIKLLKKLSDILYSDNISIARSGAYKLSWMQEDGLAILKTALLGGHSKTTKWAAAYGLRNMKGRMKKMAWEILDQGLSHNNRATKVICAKSLDLMKGEPAKKDDSQRKPKSGKQRIEEISKKGATIKYTGKKP